jgi:asparagine synthase (glutamine-hydrolysing)
MHAAHEAAAAGVSEGYLDLFASGALAREFAVDANGVPDAHTVWDLYVAHFRRNLDYHLWHEDRTAAWHSIENRVPFLDHRLLEFVARVPESLHPELFVDKQILRRAAQGLLQPQHAARPKGYLFYGKQQMQAFRMMYNIVQCKSGELVEQAIAGSQRTGGPLDPVHFRAYARDVGRDAAGDGVTRLLRLVNMGVLADMADRGVSSAKRGVDLMLGEATIVKGLPSTDKQHPPGSAEVGSDVVVRLAAGVEVSVVGSEHADVYLVRGGKPEAIDSPMWAKFLVQVDGRKTARQIIRDRHLNASSMHKQIRRALAQGILEICAPVLHGAAIRAASPGANPHG